jgi:hypothetical protein
VIFLVGGYFFLGFLSFIFTIVLKEAYCKALGPAVCSRVLYSRLYGWLANRLLLKLSQSKFSQVANASIPHLDVWLPFNLSFMNFCHIAVTVYVFNE